jgi:hypothetical protein
MGGSRSGRYGGRPTAEACGSLSLTMRRLRPAEGSIIRNTLTYECDGELFILTVTFDWSQPGYPHAVLRHPIRAEDGREIEYRVNLVRTPCRFGGWRWWWECPRTGRLAFKLFLPRGGYRFMSRRGYGLGYATQRMSPLDRAQRAKHLIEQRLWWDDDGNPCPAPGMRRRTFERLADRWQAADERVETLWEPRTVRLIERLLRR